MARSRRGGPGDAAPAGHRALSAVPAGPHHAGLPGCGGDHPDPAARGQPRQQHGVAGQPDADPGVRAADADRRADPDVEPVGGGQLLPGATRAGLPGLPAAGAGPGPGDRGGGGGQPGLGSAAHPDRGGGELPQLAAGLRVLVRRGDVAGRVDRQSGRLAAPAGPQPVADLRDRTGGLSDLGLATGRAQGPRPGHPGPVRGAHLDGRHRRRCAAGPAGSGPARSAAPDHGQSDHGDPGPVVLRVVHLASGGAGDGVPDGGHVHVQRRPGGRFRADHGAGFRDGGGQLFADRIALP